MSAAIFPQEIYAHIIGFTTLNCEVITHVLTYFYIVLYTQAIKPALLGRDKQCLTSAKLRTFIYLFIYLLTLFNDFYCIFSITSLVPIYSPPLHNHHTVVHVHESFFLFAKSLLPQPPPPLADILLSIYESVSILLVISVCSLDSTNE